MTAGDKPRHGPNATVDREMLHRLLWFRADTRHVVMIKQAELADEIGVNKYTMSRIVHQLIDAGTLEKVATAKGNVASYLVRDPDAEPGP